MVQLFVGFSACHRDYSFHCNSMLWCCITGTFANRSRCFQSFRDIIDLDVVNVKGPDWFSWFRLCEELDSFFQSNMNLS